jgi:flagellar biosynthesis/type III secretory pathway chaperone
MTIQNIAEIMGQLIEAHETYLAYGQEKTPVLVQGNIDQLIAITNKESKIAKQIVELDKQRVQAINEYLLARGYRPDPKITIGDLIKIVFKAEEKKLLMDAQMSLFTILMKVKDLNEANARLIEQSLAFIDYSLDILTGESDMEVTYQNPQQQKSAQRFSTFEGRA